MLKIYYKFEKLSDEMRSANKVRSKARLDCIAYTDLTDEAYQGLTIFVNHKGQLFFYLTPARDFVSAHHKRLAEWSLTNNSLNLSSIYIDDLDVPDVAYGYGNAKRFLSNGNVNPVYEFSNDGFLFKINKDYSVIELFIIPDGRNLISSYYQKMIDGGFDDEIALLRKLSKPFYEYGL